MRWKLGVLAICIVAGLLLASGPGMASNLYHMPDAKKIMTVDDKLFVPIVGRGEEILVSTSFSNSALSLEMPLVEIEDTWFVATESNSKLYIDLMYASEQPTCTYGDILLKTLADADNEGMYILDMEPKGIAKGQLVI